MKMSDQIAEAFAKTGVEVRDWTEYMARTTDPDLWMADGGSLLNFRLPPRTPEVAEMLAGTELAAHLGRWMHEVGAMADPELKVGNVLTEEQLRTLWEETR